MTLHLLNSESLDIKIDAKKLEMIQSRSLRRHLRFNPLASVTKIRGIATNGRKTVGERAGKRGKLLQIIKERLCCGISVVCGPSFGF